MSEKKLAQHPLVLVFYLDREMMSRQEIIGQFANSINNIIDVKKLNAIAFFLPTDGEERVECINPVIAPKEEMERIGKIIDEIQKSFNIGEKLENIPDEEIELDGESE